MTGDPGKLSNLLSIMILIIINGRLFFMWLFFFIWIIQLVPINFEFRKKTTNKQKKPLKQQQEQHEKWPNKIHCTPYFLVSDDKFHDAELWETSS